MGEYREWRDSLLRNIGKIEDNSLSYEVGKFVKNESMLDSLEMI